ncbi:MAG: TonB-dependent receptor [Burkholderiaceae bacterium]|nr:TonB-dependent receptor [Burkholderiaceae bacterium]
MSIKTVQGVQSEKSSLRRGRAPFRLKPIATVVAGMALLASGPLYAADPTIADLQAQIAQLKQIIANQNAALGNSPAKDGADANKDKSSDKDAARKDAASQEDVKKLDEVTVSGQSPLAPLQDVPLSESIVSGQELAQTGSASIASITQRMANVDWNVGNQRTASLSIRGIGKIGQTEAQDPSVGISVDGVPYAYNPLVSAFDFVDVDNASAIRGPQGTAGGKNTSVGVVNVTTNRPSFTPSADYSLTFGQENTFIGKLAAGGPVINDLLAWRGTFVVDRGDGNMTNLYNDNTTYTNTDRLSGRVQFLLTPSSTFNARLEVDSQPTAGESWNGATIYTPTPTHYANGAVNPLTTDASTRLARSWFTNESNYSYANSYLYGGGQNAVNNNAGQPLYTSSHGSSLELNWDIGKHTLTSLTAYKDYYFNAVNDEGTPFDINPNSGGFQNRYRQISQELKIANKPGGFVDYQAGVYLLKDSNNDAYTKSYGSDAGAWFANPTQYTALSATSAGQLLMQNALNRLSMYSTTPSGVQDIENRSEALYGSADWHLADKFTFTTGLRETFEQRTNVGGTFITDNGFGSLLNPVSVPITGGGSVQTGGFATTGKGALAAGNSAAQLAEADAVALQYFGVKPTGTAGAAYNSLTAAQQQQVAYAQAIRKTQIGNLFPTTTAKLRENHLPTILLSPQYKFNDNYTSYVSFQYNQKAGIAQFVNDVPNIVQPEKTAAYEWGLKVNLPEQKLNFNVDIFTMNILDYQQQVQVYDAYTTANNNNGQLYYDNVTGNASRVRANGVEIDAFYKGIPNTTLRFAGAYNNAYYVSYTNAGQAAENVNLSNPLADDTGKQLAGNAKITFNLGGDYRVPVWGGKLFHTSWNTGFVSRYNSDVALSQYAWVPAHSVTDWSIGLSNVKQTFDVSLITKNLFNNSTPQTITWNSYTPAVQRWLGLQFSGKL